MVKTRVVLVGVGGATCSGKTTLAKHLRNIIPNSVIVHQDDFAPDPSQTPTHPEYHVEDWDSPEGAVLWSKFTAFLKEVKQDGRIPLDHTSLEPLNKFKELDIDGDCFDKWRAHFEQLEAQALRDHDTQLKWALVDGFLLYWHQESMDHLDVRIFLRAGHDTLEQRRRDRDYYIPGQSGAEPVLWLDPPLYWENIAWPAYVAAHEHMFENGDVNSGQPTGDTMRDMLVLENEPETSFTELVDQCCRKITDYPLWNTPLAL